MVSKSYIDSHKSRDYGKKYDKLYSKDSYDARIWTLEKEILNKIIEKHHVKNLRNHLDFACGTGRLFEVFINSSNNPIGIDISESMLIEAKKKYKSVKFLIKDLTSNESNLNIQFDLITVFRFFLNAENSVRNIILEKFKKILTKNGFLILNIHGNKNSIRFLPYILKHFIFKSNAKNNVLSYKKMHKILLKNGFEIIEVNGLGFLPQYFSKLLRIKQWLKFEKIIANLKVFNLFGTHLIIICKKNK